MLGLGSITSALLGGLLLGVIPDLVLIAILAAVLLISAVNWPAMTSLFSILTAQRPQLGREAAGHPLRRSCSREFASDAIGDPLLPVLSRVRLSRVLVIDSA